MKILSVPDKKIVFYRRTHSCGAELEYDSTDINSELLLRDWKVRRRFFVVCPVCKKEFAHDELYRVGEGVIAGFNTPESIYAPGTK